MKDYNFNDLEPRPFPPHHPRESPALTKRIEPSVPAPVLAHYTLQAIAARITAWRESPTSYEDSVDVIENIDKLIRSAT